MTQTIELTDKKLKAQKLFASIAIVAGIVIFSFTGEDSVFFRTVAALITLGGIVWYIVVRAKIWWKHE